MIYAMDSQRTMNSFHYLNSTGYTSIEMSALCADMVSNFNTVLKDQYPATCQLIEVKATDLQAQNGPSVIYGTGLPIAGTRAGAQLPNSCCLCITKRTALRGRSFRGRSYFGPLTETDVTGNVASSTFVTSLLSDWSSYLSRTVGGEVWDLVVISRKQNGQWLEFGDSTRVIGFTSDGVIDSQRRRLPGRGA